MATTQKGIYYPDDYTAIADIPEDMKDLAESVDTALGDLEDNVEQDIQPQVDDIVSEQTTQNNNIEALQIENARLKATLPTTTGEGTEVTLQNTAELEFIQPPLPKGNSKQVEYSGKNLYSSENISSLISNVQYTSQEDGTILANGTKSGGGWANFSNNTVQLEPGTYSATCFLISGTISTSITVYLYDASNSQSINISELGRTGKTFEITEAGTYYLRFGVWTDGTVFNNAKIGFMLVSGSEIPTTFEKYVGGTASPNPSYSQEITNVTGDVEVLVQNKNYFDLNKILYGEIDSNGDLSLYAATRDFYKIDFKENTQCTISGYVKRTSGNVRLRCMYTDGTYSEFFNPAASDNFSFSSFTSLANKTIDKIVVYYGSAGYLYIKDGEMQIEQNTTASTYTPHAEQTYTFPLGTQRMYLGDYLADDGIHHVRGQITLDGTENFENWTSGTNTIGFKLANVENLKDIASSSRGILFSNYFIASTSQNALINNDLEGIATTVGNLYFRINKTTASNLANFKTWLSTHNTIVEYELAEETVTPYTTEQQTAYDEIKQAISYEEQTNISGSSDESNPLFSVEAYQSIKLILAS